MRDTVPFLDYGTLPGRRWRRRIVRAVSAVLILACGWFAYTHWNEVSLRIQRRYWYRQCLAHTAPPGTKLHEFDAQKTTSGDRESGAVFPPAMHADVGFWIESRPHSYYSPRAWRKFGEVEYALAGPRFQFQEGAIAFLGALKTPGGQTRLVRVNIFDFDGDGLLSALYWRVYKEPGLFTPSPVQPLFEQRLRLGMRGLLGYPAKFSPGVADPADATHASIPFRMVPERTGGLNTELALDLYLRDDNRLDVRIHYPTTARQSPATAGGKR